MPSITSRLSHKPLSVQPWLQSEEGGQPLRWFLFSKQPQKHQGKTKKSNGAVMSDFTSKPAARPYIHTHGFPVSICICVFVFQVNINSTLSLSWAALMLWPGFDSKCIMIWRWVRQTYSGNENILEKHFIRTGSESWWFVCSHWKENVRHKSPSFESAGHFTFSIYGIAEEAQQRRLYFW